MSTRPRTGQVSFAEFLEFVREDQKADLIDGVIYMASPENLDHNRLLAWLNRIIGFYLEHTHQGEVMLDRVAYRLASKTAPEPDVGVVLAENAGRLKPGYVDGPPDLAIEIVSPDSIERDYEDKRRRYEEGGVQEYWIIDRQEQRATFLVRERDHFVEVQPAEHVYRSRVLPGLTLDTRWLWQQPLPDTLPIVLRMIGRGDS